MTEMRPSDVRVWDPLVRAFHWCLVLAFAIAWASGDEWDALHETTGYVILGLLGIRVAWGLIGTRYARFTQFVRGPATVKDYLGQMVIGREQRFIGHNPAGGAMVVTLILAMAATGLTGWMTTLDAFWGYKWVEHIHEFLANGMLVLVAVHVAGVLFASIRHHENLVGAMLTGRKRAPTPGDVA